MHASVALLTRLLQPVTIADTDSPGLHCVSEQIEGGEEGGREEVGKNGKKNADTPESLRVTSHKQRVEKKDQKKVERKVRLHLARGCLLMEG